MEQNGIFLKKHFILSSKDHPGKLSALAYTDVMKCNLSCYKCHNKYSGDKDLERCSERYAIDRLKGFAKIGCELIIISGGEPTLFTEELIEILPKIRKFLPVRIDSNGTNPESISRLKNLVDGFAIDIKIPAIFRESDRSRYKEILGIEDVDFYIEKVLESVSIVDGMPYSLFRTVEYPLLMKEDKLWIREYVKTLQSRHYFNKFVNFEDGGKM